MLQQKAEMLATQIVLPWTHWPCGGEAYIDIKRSERLGQTEGK